MTKPLKKIEELVDKYWQYQSKEIKTTKNLAIDAYNLGVRDSLKEIPPEIWGHSLKDYKENIKNLIIEK